MSIAGRSWYLDLQWEQNKHFGILIGWGEVDPLFVIRTYMIYNIQLWFEKCKGYKKGKILLSNNGMIIKNKSKTYCNIGKMESISTKLQIIPSS